MALSVTQAKEIGEALRRAGYFNVSGGGGGGGLSGAFVFAGLNAWGPYASLDRLSLGPAPVGVTFPSATADAGRSVAVCEIAPTGDVDLILTDDFETYIITGENVIATVHFDAGETTGTITYGDAVEVAQGTQLWIVMPASADATLALFKLLFCGDQITE